MRTALVLTSLGRRFWAAGLEASAEVLAKRLDALAALAGATEALITPGDVPALAAEAATQWTGTFNPRPMDVEAFEALFRTAAEGAAASNSFSFPAGTLLRCRCVRLGSTVFGTRTPPPPKYFSLNFLSR